MPFAYPVKMREKAVNAYLEGKGKQAKIADIFGISISTLRRYLFRHAQDGDVAPKPYLGRAPILDEQDLQWIKCQVQRKPDIGLKELCGLLKEHNDKVVSVPTMCRAYQRLDLRRKKKSFYAVEQDREETKKAPRLPRYR